MRPKDFIAISVAMLLLTGCTQENNEKQPVTGKIDLQEKFKDVLKTLNESVGKDKDEKAVKEKADNGTETESVGDENVSSSSDNSSMSKSNAEQKPSSQSSQNKAKGESNQQSSPQEQAKQDTSQQQTPEPSKPAEPVNPQPEPKPEPKPSVPVCDDTIPAGAYPISREDEITSQVEAEMIKNLNEGKPTFEQYSIEYGVTKCGTEYFYIIKK